MSEKEEAGSGLLFGLLRPLEKLMLLTALLIIAYIRFTNIDTTEPRLLAEYWPWWVLSAILAGFGGGRVFSRFYR